MQMIRKPLVPEDLDGDRLASEQRRSLHRALTATALGALRQKPTATVLRQCWPSDELAGLVTRSPVSPLGRDGFPQATVTSMDVLSLVAPASAAAQLFARCMRLDLGSSYAVNVPNAATVPLPVFVGEGGAIPAAQASFAASAIGPARKMALICGLTGEIEAASPESASAIVGRLMAQAATRSLDNAVFGNA